YMYFLVVFLQAEDVILDRNVTGVQTCALPIYLIYSSVLPGIVIGILLKIDFYKAIANIISVFPHTTLEILGFCIFASVLFQLNKSIRSKIRELFKKNGERTSIIKSLYNTVKIYIFVVIQVIVLAAIFEEYI